MPTAYDTLTAYRKDWELLDGVENGTLVHRASNAEPEGEYSVKLLRADVTRPDFQRFGVAANFSPEETVWFLWLVYQNDLPDPPAPRFEDAFEVPNADPTKAPDHWMIQTVGESRIGSLYVLGCVKGRRNAA